MSELNNAYRELERAAGHLGNHTYVLELYIAGSSPRSQRAVVNVQTMCSELSKDTWSLRIIDIFQQPLLAKVEQIVAVPTLIKKFPSPRRLFIGDMPNAAAVLSSLES